MDLAPQSALSFLEEHRRGRLDLAEEYDLTPWSCSYAALHHFGYPNHRLPKGKQSTFSYVFVTPYDGLFLELSDFKAFVTVHLAYSDVAGLEMAERHKEELRAQAQKLLAQLKEPVDHFGALFDPLTCTFTE